MALVGALELGAGPEIVTVPLRLAGFGIGALASQLGAVTVSSVSDEPSGEVGGLQNTLMNLGASLGTALAGSILIATLTMAFVQGIEENPAAPTEISTQAGVELAAGVPFVSDAQLEDALHDAGIQDPEAQAIVDENEKARILALRASLAVLAIAALVALFLTRMIPVEPVGSSTDRPDRSGKTEPS
jgi:hypothetical protein